MEKRFLKKLVEYLLIMSDTYNIDVIRNDKNYLVLKDNNYYLILVKYKKDFLKVLFVDCKTFEVEEEYNTQSLFYREVYQIIRNILIRLSYKKINE